MRNGKNNESRSQDWERCYKIAAVKLSRANSRISVGVWHTKFKSSNFSEVCLFLVIMFKLP